MPRVISEKPDGESRIEVSEDVIDSLSEDPSILTHFPGSLQSLRSKLGKDKRYGPDVMHTTLDTFIAAFDKIRKQRHLPVHKTLVDVPTHNFEFATRGAKLSTVGGFLPFPADTYKDGSRKVDIDGKYGDVMNDNNIDTGTITVFAQGLPEVANKNQTIQEYRQRLYDTWQHEGQHAVDRNNDGKYLFKQNEKPVYNGFLQNEATNYYTQPVELRATARVIGSTLRRELPELGKLKYDVSKSYALAEVLEQIRLLFMPGSNERGMIETLLILYAKDKANAQNAFDIFGSMFMQALDERELKDIPSDENIKDVKMETSSFELENRLKAIAAGYKGTDNLKDILMAEAAGYPEDEQKLVVDRVLASCDKSEGQQNSVGNKFGKTIAQAVSRRFN